MRRFIGDLNRELYHLMDGNHYMKTAEKGCVSELMHHTYLTLGISSGLYLDVHSTQHRICFPFLMNNELVVQ